MSDEMIKSQRLNVQNLIGSEKSFANGAMLLKLLTRTQFYGSSKSAKKSGML